MSVTMPGFVLPCPALGRLGEQHWVGGGEEKEQAGGLVTHKHEAAVEDNRACVLLLWAIAHQI
jgi:hypothetical protein